jgi:hypothetical protein
LFSLCTKGGGFRGQWSACLAAGLLLVLPIILFVHRYIDDYGRSMDGEYLWSEVGRPLADGLFFLVNLGTPAVAVAPLHQLLSIVLLSAVCVIAARVYGIRSPTWTALCTLPLLGQPYALENLSYGFDCLGMAMSLSLAVIAAVLIAIVPDRAGLITSSFLLTASLCLYQPGTSAFLPFALMLVVGRELGLVDAAVSDRPAVGGVSRILVSYLLALGLYRLLLVMVFRSPTSYAEEQGRLLSFDRDFPFALLQHAWLYWRVIYDDWNGWPIAGLFIALGLAYAAVVWQSLPIPADRGGIPWARRPTSFVVVLATVVVIALVSPGALLALEDPLTNVPRVLLFVGPFLAALNLQIMAGITVLSQGSGSYRCIRTAQQTAVVAFAWLLVVFSYAYGHAFAAQADFENGRLARLVDGIARLQQRQGSARATSLSFVGGMPKSPVLLNTQRKFPLVDRLVPRLINDDWPWGWQQLKLQGVDLDRSHLQQEDLSDAYCQERRTAECTAEYNLQIQGDALLVRMK